MPNNNENKKLINVEITRKDGETYFNFKIDEKVQDLYEDICEETKESSNWQGLEFYHLPSNLRSESYNKKLNHLSLFDDYGQSLFKDGRFNIAWIRTKGGEGKIKLNGALSFAEISSHVRSALTFIKNHLEEDFSDFKIKGHIEMEI